MMESLRPKSQADSIQIGPFTINAASPAFIIAEIGINHNGSVALAKQLVDQAIWAGADCAKFQMRDIKALYHNAGDPNDAREDLGSQYVLDVLSLAQLSRTEMFEIFTFCHDRGILPLCTPWDLPSLAALEGYGMMAYKVASADLTNHDLIEALARTGKPLLLSTGMSTEQEIMRTVALLKRRRASYVLLHCIATYPAPFKDVNLRYLERLQKLGDCLVGYSGHERGYAIPLAAVARGAKVIEKHLTLDKTMEGNDHKVSLLPAEFKAMVEGIRHVEAAMGDSGARTLSQGERMNRENLAKSLMSTCTIRPGDVITRHMIQVKSPGKGLQPDRLPALVGRKAKRTIRAGDFFFETDVQETLPVAARHYTFKRRWGVPVRYHDCKTLRQKSNMDFLEFHLSYKDLDEDISRFFSESYDLDLIVHSPDLFAGDHLLDLAAADESYRQRSVEKLQRVIEITRALKSYFKRATRPLVIVSVGGFTKDKPLCAADRAPLYERVAQSLSELGAADVELIPQTLPPFPWYFGGQLFCNIFVDAEEIVTFCRQHHYRICLDVSHSKLATNHRQSRFSDFIEQVGPCTAHLHLVDAVGVDGEGLQIGEGDIDFPALAEQLGRVAPVSSFIPEIWQGHKNEGEGFWIALERLEKWF